MLNLSYFIFNADFLYRLNINVSSYAAFILSDYHRAVHLAILWDSYPTPSSRFHAHLVAIVLRCEKIISNFSWAESPRRHWSSRQVTPVAAKSALFSRTPLIPTPAFHHYHHHHHHNHHHHRHHRRCCCRCQHHHLRSSTTIYSGYHLLREALAMWLTPLLRWRAVGLPTCRPLPRSHYDADSRGRCTNLSATPLTCVCAY